MPAATPRPTSPATDLRLARLHLRMGQLGLARAELEALAGSGNLDDDGLLALAEARWRTGDLTGAGEAAQAYLEPGGQAIVARVIAAESVAAAGRPVEARKIAGRALDGRDVPLDRIFAGMPRSAIWPVDPAAAALPTGTLFGTDGATKGRGRDARGRGRGVVAAVPDAPVEPAKSTDGPGFWDVDEPGAEDLPEPAEALEQARSELGAGHLDEAAVRLAIVLRLAPELAPAILEATNARGRRSPQIELVRGDAFRVVGHELDARHAYAAAAAGINSAAGNSSSPDE